MYHKCSPPYYLILTHIQSIPQTARLGTWRPLVLIRSYSVLFFIMTSIDYRSMMKEARAKSAMKSNTASAPPVVVEEQEMKLEGSSSDGERLHHVERFDYSMDEETEHFHKIFEKWKVGLIDHVYYVPDFIDESTESILLHHINSQPESRWTQLKRRRLQNWGGFPSSEGMTQEKLPDWLMELCDRLYSEKYLPIRPNHALINEYKGEEGITAHKDGPLYFPRVIILSLGGSTQLNFRDRLRDPSQELSLLLKPRSLFIFTKDAYELYYHEIPTQANDHVSNNFINVEPHEIGKIFPRSTRVSLTLRIVPVVKKLLQDSTSVSEKA